MTPTRRSEPRTLPRGVRPQVGVDLPWRRSEDKSGDGVPRYFDVAERTEDVDLGVGEDDTGPRGVLNDESSLSLVSGETTDRTSEMVAVEGLDVLDLERFLYGGGKVRQDPERCREQTRILREEGEDRSWTNNVELLQSQHGDSVVDGETKAVGGKEIGGASESRGVRGVLRGLLRVEDRSRRGAVRGGGRRDVEYGGAERRKRVKRRKGIVSSRERNGEKEKKRTFISTCLFPTFILTCNPHSSTKGV